MGPPALRRRLVLAVGTIASMLISGLMLGDRLLVPPAGDPPPAAATSRPVTAAEAARLAGVRSADYRAGHAAVRVSIGTGPVATYLTGWVDWRQQLVYLNRVGATAGPADGLLQAVPGVVAVRAGRYRPPVAAGAQVDPFPAPPPTAPPTGWRVSPAAADPALDTVLTLLFTLRSPTADDAARILAAGTRFVGTDEIDGVPVDMLDGPADLPTRTAPGAGHPASATTGSGTAGSATPVLDAQGGQVRYWVDARCRLLRVEAVVHPATLLRVDLDPTDTTVPTAIELLGGAPVAPAAPTARQLTALARMRSRDYAAGGGTLTLAVPQGPDELLSAEGWLDWRQGVAYLTVRNNATPGPDDTWRVHTAGVTYQVPTGGPAARAAIAPPALPPPDVGWHDVTWADRTGDHGPSDLDTLLRVLLAQAAPTVDGRARLARYAIRLRADTVDGVPVTVYEIRGPARAGIPGATAGMRYWLDAQGRLRRLELRTRSGAWAYATVRPGPVPRLPDPLAGGAGG